MGLTDSKPELSNVTYCEVNKHKYWLFYDKYVYDIESYVDLHPGGRGCLLRAHDKWQSISGDIEHHHSKSKSTMKSKITGKISRCADQNCQLCHHS